MVNKIRNSTSKPAKTRLKKGDKVIVLNGKNKGKTGKVSAVFPKLNKVTVDGVNVVKKHQKPNKAYPQGGIIDVAKPIHISNIGVLDPDTKKPTGIGYKLSGKNKKVRIYKSSGKEIK